MAFSDDLGGRSRAEQIALIQAAARGLFAALARSEASASARPAGAPRPCRAAGAQGAARTTEGTRS